jgi:hypothetical protein
MKRVLPSCYHPDQEANEVDGNLSYCLQCYGKVAHTRKESDDEEEVPLSIRIASGHCCCGCGLDASASNHYCIHTGKRVMAWYFHEAQEIDEGYGSKALCKGCFGQKKSEGEEDEEDESEEVEEEEESNESKEEEEPVRNQIASGRCCCGCGLDAAVSNHYCIHTGKRVMAWCYYESQEVEEGHGSKALCKGCYDTIAPKMEHPIGKQ